MKIVGSGIFTLLSYYTFAIWLSKTANKTYTLNIYSDDWFAIVMRIRWNGIPLNDVFAKRDIHLCVTNHIVSMRDWAAEQVQTLFASTPVALIKYRVWKLLRSLLQLPSLSRPPFISKHLFVICHLVSLKCWTFTL